MNAKKLQQQQQLQEEKKSYEAIQKNEII